MVLRPDQFTEQAQEVLQASQEVVRRYHHTQWDSEHILMALLEQENGVPADIFREVGISVAGMRDRLHQLLDQGPKIATETAQMFDTPRTRALLQRAKREAERMSDEFIGSEHLLVAAIQEDQGDAARVVAEFRINLESVYQALKKIRAGHRVTDPRAESRYQSLERFSIDLTRLAEEGRLDPVIGRETEIARAMQTGIALAVGVGISVGVGSGGGKGLEVGTTSLGVGTVVADCMGVSIVKVGVATAGADGFDGGTDSVGGTTGGPSAWLQPTISTSPVNRNSGQWLRYRTIPFIADPSSLHGYPTPGTDTRCAGSPAQRCVLHTQHRSSMTPPHP